MAPHDNDSLSHVAENMRFYGDMRFKQLTLFMAAMTAVAGGIMQYAPARWWIALAGLCITGAMWVMEVRSTLYAVATCDAAPRAWPLPKPKLFPWLTASLVVLLLYIGFYATWLICLRVWCPKCMSFYVGLVVGLVLLAFSIVNYWDRRTFWLGRN